MKKNFRKALITLAVVFMVITTFSACDIGMPWDTAVWGTWISPDDWGGTTKLVITNKTFENYYKTDSDYKLMYSGEILDFSNHGFNVDESSDYKEYGFILVKLTKSTSQYTPVGTCFVERWQKMETTDGVTTVLMSEGYGAERFTTEADALNGMTAKDGYFGTYSKFTESE